MRDVPGSALLQAIRRGDERGLSAAASARRPLLSALFVPAAYTGAGGLPWVALVLLLRSRARDGSRLPLFCSTAGIVGGWGAAQLLKRLIGRERPCRRGHRALIPCPDGPSLPSDQAASAFAGAAAIAPALPSFALAAYAAASLTAFSRLYAGVHYPTDVAAGALVGALVGRAALRAQR